MRLTETYAVAPSTTSTPRTSALISPVGAGVSAVSCAYQPVLTTWMATRLCTRLVCDFVPVSVYFVCPFSPGSLTRWAS